MQGRQSSANASRTVTTSHMTTHHFNGHFPGEAGSASFIFDSHSPPVVKTTTGQQCPFSITEPTVHSS